MGESSAPVASWCRLMDECQTPYSTGSLACRTAACSVSEVLRCLVRVPYGPVGDGQVELVGTSEVSADHRAAGALGVCPCQHHGAQPSVVLKLRRRQRADVDRSLHFPELTQVELDGLAGAVGSQLDPAQERIGLGLQDPLPGHDPFPLRQPGATVCRPTADHHILGDPVALKNHCCALQLNRSGSDRSTTSSGSPAHAGRQRRAAS